MSSLEPGTLLERLATVGDSSSDDRDTKVRKHAFAVTIAGLVPAALLWAVIGALSERPLLLAGSLVFAGAAIAILAGFAVTKQLRRLVEVTLLAGLVYVVLGHLALGGLAAGAGSLTWGLLAPVVAVLLLGTRDSIRWFAVYVAIVVAAIGLDPLVAELQPPRWTIPPPLLFGYNLFGPAVVVVLLVRYVDGQRDAAQRRYGELLSDMLPPAAAERLARGERLIAEHHPSVSILFADLVNFTPYAERARPQELLLMLNDLFVAFDRLAARHGVEKIKTLGDAYMAAAGAPDAREDHADALVAFAIEMHHEVRRRATMRARNLVLRVGIASGPVTAGVIGRRRLAYDVWGDTVNLASRLQSTAEAGTIQVSAETAGLVRQKLPLVRRPGVPIKGKGVMTTFVIDPAHAADHGVIESTAASSSSPVEEQAGEPA